HVFLALCIARQQSPKTQKREQESLGTAASRLICAATDVRVLAGEARRGRQVKHRGIVLKESPVGQNFFWGRRKPRVHRGGCALFERHRMLRHDRKSVGKWRRSVPEIPTSCRNCSIRGTTVCRAFAGTLDTVQSFKTGDRVVAADTHLYRIGD